MNEATITFKPTANGAVEMLTAYAGGYDSDNPAHIAATLLSEGMNELGEPQGDPIHLTQAEYEAMQAGKPAAAAGPQLVLARG